MVDLALISYICFAQRDLKLKLETLNRVSMKPFPFIYYIPFLLDPLPEVREKAIENLIRFPPSQAIPLLINIIAKTYSSREKEKALYTLSLFPSEAVISFLKETFEYFPATATLNSREFEASISPEELLQFPHKLYLFLVTGAHSVYNYRQKVIDTLCCDPSLQLFIPFFLTVSKGETIKAILLHLLREEEERTVKDALIALSKYRDPELLPFIFSRFENPSGSFAITIVLNCLPFFRKFAREVLPFITSYLSSPVQFYRMMAFEALRILRIPDFIPLAINVLERDEDLWVALAAAAYLIKIKKRKKKYWDILAKRIAPEDLMLFVDKYPFVLLYMPPEFFVSLPKNVQKVIVREAIEHGLKAQWLILF